MPEGTPKQTSENIQKLFDFNTRIDERVKSISNEQEQLDEKIERTNQKYNELCHQLAFIEAQAVTAKDILAELKTFNDDLSKLDKRLAKLESQQGAYDERWKNLASFLIQLVWVILAAYLLTKLNLQTPSVP
jgi:chromosome segregation ATPase